jgi:hypothetical protein
MYLSQLAIALVFFSSFYQDLGFGLKHIMRSSHFEPLVVDQNVSMPNGMDFINQRTGQIGRRRKSGSILHDP